MSLYHQELLTPYKEKLSRIPQYIPQDEIEQGVLSLRQAPTTIGEHILFETLSRNNGKMSTTEQTRLERLICLHEELESCAYSLFKNIDQYRVRVLKCDTQREAWEESILQIKKCWISGFSSACASDTLRILDWLYQDGGTGACIYAIIEEASAGVYVPVSETRFYLTHNKRGETVLFYDAFEGGIPGFSRLDEWRSEGKAQEISLSFIAALYLMRELGIQKLACGDMESEDFSLLLGFTRKIVYNSDSERKMGISGDVRGLSGPYVHTLFESSSFPVLYLPSLEKVDEKKVVDRTDELWGKRSKKDAERFWGYWGNLRQEVKGSRFLR